MRGPPGSYILFLRLPKDTLITVGRLGTICFRAGLYAYVGSALGGWEARVNRHLSVGATTHWHVDYLRAESLVEGVIVFESPERLECIINQAITRASLEVAPGFGSSDCGCSSHLHFLRSLSD